MAVSAAVPILTLATLLAIGIVSIVRTRIDARLVVAALALSTVGWVGCHRLRVVSTSWLRHSRRSRWEYPRRSWPATRASSRDPQQGNIKLGAPAAEAADAEAPADAPARAGPSRRSAATATEAAGGVRP